ncbi:uncharacterized protein LOC126838666 [Adelges cooleyi]|uniref:uncharacterized protein LOC126838666 n=1 Tax=Adelges cooleyi TaxID=133065 RepID=UPI0021806965|nr:uncharacterized protein LOC126838666 [Adelges cooleyi]
MNLSVFAAVLMATVCQHSVKAMSIETNNFPSGYPNYGFYGSQSQLKNAETITGTPFNLPTYLGINQVATLPYYGSAVGYSAGGQPAYSTIGRHCVCSGYGANGQCGCVTTGLAAKKKELLNKILARRSQKSNRINVVGGYQQEVLPYYRMY